MTRLSFGKQIVRHETDRDGREVILYGFTDGKLCSDCGYMQRTKYDGRGKIYPRCILSESLSRKNFKLKTPACSQFKPRKEA